MIQARLKQFDRALNNLAADFYRVKAECGVEELPKNENGSTGNTAERGIGVKLDGLLVRCQEALATRMAEQLETPCKGRFEDGFTFDAYDLSVVSTGVALIEQMQKIRRMD